MFAKDVTTRKQMEARLLHADRMSALGSLAARVGQAAGAGGCAPVAAVIRRPNAQHHRPNGSERVTLRSAASRGQEHQRFGQVVLGDGLHERPVGKVAVQQPEWSGHQGQTHRKHVEIEALPIQTEPGQRGVPLVEAGFPTARQPRCA